MVSQKQIGMYVCFIIVSVCVICYLVIVRPAVICLKGNALKAKLLQSQYTQALHAIVTLEGYQEQVAVLDKFIASLGATSRTENQLVVLLSVILKQSGVQLKSLLPLEHKGVRYIKVNAIGDYCALMRALTLLIKNTAYLTPEEVDIRASEAQLNSDIRLLLKVNLQEKQ